MGILLLLEIKPLFVVVAEANLAELLPIFFFNVDFYLLFINDLFF